MCIRDREEIEDKLNNMYLVLESLILETENGKLKACLLYTSRCV